MKDQNPKENREYGNQKKSILKMSLVSSVTEPY